MKYCTNCGRQLADDEVCTCRQQAQPQAPNQTQDNNAQADNAAQQDLFLFLALNSYHISYDLSSTSFDTFCVNCRCYCHARN